MINKQATGLRFGINPVKLIRVCGELPYDNGIYKLALIEAYGRSYYTLRLYNRQGRFIKQLIFEPEILRGLIDLLMAASKNAS